MSAEDELSQIKQLLSQIRDQNAVSAGTGSQSSQDLDQYSRELKLARSELDLLEKGSSKYNRKQKEVERLTRLTRNAMSDQRRESDALSLSMNGLGAAFDMLTNAIDTVVVKFGQLVSGIASQAKELDTLTMQFKASTGASDQLSSHIGLLGDRMSIFGVSTQEAAQAVGSLQSGFTMFTRLDRDTQDSIVTTVGLLQELGVSADKSASMLDTSMRVMGLSVAESNKLLMDMRSTAKALQIPVEQVTADFQAAEMRISQLGDRGPKAFQKLEAASKGTGVAVTDLLGLVGQFDTFTGAAQTASKLGAVLGTAFIDPITMMQLEEPADQVAYLIDALEKSGLTAEKYTNSHRQYQMAIASAMNTDTVTVAKLLSGEIESLNDALEQSAYSFEDMKNEAFKLKGFDEIVNNFSKGLTRPVTQIQRATRATFDSFTPLIADFEKYNKSIFETTEKFVAANSEVVGAVGILYNLAGVDGVQKGYEMFKGMASFTGAVLNNVFSIKGVLGLMVGGALYSISDKFGEIRKAFDKDGIMGALSKTFDLLKDKFFKVKQDLVDKGFNKEFFVALLDKMKSFAKASWLSFHRNFIEPMMPTIEKFLMTDGLYYFNKFSHMASGLLKKAISSQLGGVSRYILFGDSDHEDVMADHAAQRDPRDRQAYHDAYEEKLKAEKSLATEQGRRAHAEKLAASKDLINAHIQDKIMTMRLEETKGMKHIAQKQAEATKEMNKAVKVLEPTITEAKKKGEELIEFGAKTAKDGMDYMATRSGDIAARHAQEHYSLLNPYGQSMKLIVGQQEMDAYLDHGAQKNFNKNVKKSIID